MAVIVAGVAPLLDGQETIDVRPAIRQTAAEQLSLSHELRIAVASAESEEERAYAMANAIAHAEVVVQRWPSDDNAVLDARLLQASIFHGQNAFKNATEILDLAIPIATRLGREGMVHAQHASNFLKARQHGAAAAAADLAVHKRGLAGLLPEFRAAILADVARTYSALSLHRKASAALRNAAAEESDALRRAQYWLFAARADRENGDGARSREAAARADADLMKARSTAARGNASLALLGNLQREVDAILERE